jgi:hypothetical protein
MRSAVICPSACAFAFAFAFSGPAAADEPRDPMRPPAASAHLSVVHEPAPVLSAIMGAQGARVAIFNGQLVRSGGSVGTYLIDAVLEDGVRYRHHGMTQELHLAHATNPVKKPSTAPARLPAGAP